MSKGGWTAISAKDIEEPESYTLQPHSSKKLGKKLPWEYCPKCGLIFVRNQITQWCTRMGCNNEKHPLYKSTLLKLTR